MKINESVYSMHYGKKTLFICLLMSAVGFLPLSAHTEEKDDSRNPIGCRDIGYLFDLKTLTLMPYDDGTGNSLYFMHNKLSKPVTLFQMRDEDSARSVYFNHKIDANYWAVLATAEKKMKYICTVSEGKSAYGKVVDCAESLQVCEYNHVKFGLNNRGNYWLANSSTRGGAVGAVVRYGIIPGI